MKEDEMVSKIVEFTRLSFRDNCRLSRLSDRTFETMLRILDGRTSSSQRLAIIMQIAATTSVQIAAELGQDTEFARKIMTECSSSLAKAITQENIDILKRASR